VARTVHLGLLRGRPEPLSAAEVERAHRAYVEHYGQRSEHA
jgi:hypothetical protein